MADRREIAAVFAGGAAGGLLRSVLEVELPRMVDAHYYGLAVGYAAGSVVAGYVAVQVATAMVRRVPDMTAWGWRAR